MGQGLIPRKLPADMGSFYFSGFIITCLKNKFLLNCRIRQSAVVSSVWSATSAMYIPCVALTMFATILLSTNISASFFSLYVIPSLPSPGSMRVSPTTLQMPSPKHATRCLLLLTSYIKSNQISPLVCKTLDPECINI